MMRHRTHTFAASPRGNRRAFRASPVAEPPSEEPPSRTPPRRNITSEPHVTIILHDPNAIRVNTQWLRDQLIAALPYLAQLAAKPIGNITILLADDQRISALHNRYMQIDSPTDVLTFDLSEPNEHAINADIALGLEVAQRQAQQRGHTVERELLLYAIHGLLHTLGFDDHDDAAYATMHAEEDRILSAIGVGPTFESRGAIHSEPSASPDTSSSDGGTS